MDLTAPLDDLSAEHGAIGARATTINVAAPTAIAWPVVPQTPPAQALDRASTLAMRRPAAP